MNIDPHLHFGGSIPPSFVWQTIQEHGLKHLGESFEDVYSQMTFAEGEQRNFHRFLNKFKILDELPWTEELIDGSIKAVCQYLDSNSIDYAWMDFSINKYMGIGWHKFEAIKFIYNSFEQHRPGKIGLILSIKYESMRASQKQYAKLIEDPDVAKCLLGIDLVGDESYFDVKFYKPLFKGWNDAGKITRAHVGESQSVLNVFHAIIDLGVTNIAHGIKIVDSCPEIVQEAKNRKITFDLSLTSNYITGVWEQPNFHPITRMLDAGLNVTLGSDDPVQCNTTLAKEFERAKSLGITGWQCDLMRNTAHINTVAALRSQGMPYELCSGGSFS